MSARPASGAPAGTRAARRGTRAGVRTGTRAAVLAALRGRLERAGIVSAESEAEAILLHGLGLSRTAFWSEPGAPLATEEIRDVDALAAKRERRVPLQHLIGEVDFHDVTLTVEPGVFIPRPETESLVDAAVEAVAETGPAGGGRLLDLGTGTGAVAVALLHALPGWTAVAIDRSPAAVALAARNAARNGLGARLDAVRADFRDPDDGAWAAETYDLVVSNPPYVPTGALDGLMPEVRDHDPREALDGGADGLDAYRAIAALTPRVLRRGGVLALEIGEDQADGILRTLGPALGTARVREDLAGRQRVVVGTWRGGVA